VPKTTSDPHHYWRKSIRGRGLAEAVPGSQFSGEVRSLWPVKSWAMGYLQQVGGALKTTLIAAYLAGKVEVGVETCWKYSYQSSESRIANKFSKNLLHF